MDCINWVGKDGSTYEDPTKGRHSWTEGDAVDFYWFDGRAYVDSSVADADRVSVWINDPAWDQTHKWKKESKTLEMKVTAGADSLIQGAAAVIAVTMMYAF